MWSPRTHSLSFQGPEPTGLMLYGLFAKSSFSQICLGMIPAHRLARKTGSGPLSVTTTVDGLGVCMSFTSPFAQSITNILNFKLSVERRPQAQPSQDVLL